MYGDVNTRVSVTTWTLEVKNSRSNVLKRKMLEQTWEPMSHVLILRSLREGISRGVLVGHRQKRPWRDCSSMPAQTLLNYGKRHAPSSKLGELHNVLTPDDLQRKELSNLGDLTKQQLAVLTFFWFCRFTPFKVLLLNVRVGRPAWENPSCGQADNHFQLALKTRGFTLLFWMQLDHKWIV